MSKYYTEKNIDISHLKDWEMQALDHFKKAAKVAGEIFALQKNDEFMGANFYPDDATKDQIREAAKSDGKIFDLYTLVKRDDNGDLYSVGYYEEYKEQIDEIIENLLAAAEVYENERYKEYLKQLVEDMKSDNYVKSELLYLEIDDVDLDIRIGPIEAYVDKLFGIKRAFQGNIRTLDRSGEFDDIKEYINVLGKIYPESPFSGDKPKLKLNVRMDNIIVESGWHAYLVPPANNYPKRDVVEGEEYDAAKVLVYINNFGSEKKQDLSSIAEEVYHDDLLDEASAKDLDRAHIKFFALNNIVQAMVRYDLPKLKDRLVNYADPVTLIYSKLLGIKSASVQVLQGLESHESYKALLLIFPLIVVKNWKVAKDYGKDYRMTFASGYIVAMNYLIEKEGVFVDGSGKIEFDYTKLYAAIDSLISELEEIMYNGEYAQVKEFFRKYSSLDVYEKHYS